MAPPSAPAAAVPPSFASSPPPLLLRRWAAGCGWIRRIHVRWHRIQPSPSRIRVARRRWWLARRGSVGGAAASQAWAAVRGRALYAAPRRAGEFAIGPSSVLGRGWASLAASQWRRLAVAPVSGPGVAVPTPDPAA
jgi:hypothetical protein